MKLNDLLDGTARCTVEYQGHTIEIEYYSSRLTLDFLGRQPDALEQITHLVKWWNIEDDGGEVDVAKTAPRLPVQLLAAILEKIIAEMQLAGVKNAS